MESKATTLRRRVYTVLRADRKSMTIVPESARIVALQPKGEGQPFFMVDSCDHFIDVVKLMGTGRPILSLIPREETHTLPSGVYDLQHEAADHVKTILDNQPRGSLMLGGFSASGIVAFEIAQQLLARGRQVALLVLFEAPNPYFMCEYSAFWNRLVCHRADLARMRWAEIPGWGAGKLWRTGRGVRRTKLHLRGLRSAMRA
jgi:hypothetical protein